MFYKLIVKSKTSFLDRLFTYASDEKLELGTRVIVPFGNADVKSIAIVVEEIKEKPDFPAKKITEVLDSKPLISEELLDRVSYLTVRFYYEAGRDEKVKSFIETAKLLPFLKGIKTRKQYIQYYQYMEALVAFHKYHGGKDQ